MKRVQSPAPLSVAAALAGDADYTLAVNSAAAAVVGANAPIKIILGLAVRPLQTVVAHDPSINSLADLRGRVIGVPRSNTVLNLFRIAVAAQGMNPDTSVMTEELSQSPQRLAALQTGQMAAAVLAPVYLEQAEQAGAHALPEVQLPLVPTSGLAASLTTLESPSATAEGMVRASLRAVQLMRQNPEDTVTLISDHLGVSRPAAERAYTLAIDAFSPEGIIPEQALQVVIDLVRASTGSRTTVTPAQLADFSLARRVAQP